MSKATLAVVDDDKKFLKSVAKHLKSGGYLVQTYTGGAALLQVLQSGTLPSLIVLDVEMPGLDGIETLRAIKTVQPTVPVVMVSARSQPATIIEAVRLGAADYVPKPTDTDTGPFERSLETAIRNALQRAELMSEIERLSAKVGSSGGEQPHWGSGDAMQAVLELVGEVSDNDVGILLRGETGVGKEVVAREVHRRSPRREKPFVKVNCAAIPADLIESELFGFERGAFTGAGNARVGKFEFADGGTIMLDEVGELPVNVQSKILHVLEDRQVTKIGSNQTVEVDVRILAATNRNLEEMIREKKFREDLYYRLQVIEVYVPPLRERRDEIPALVELFIRRYATLYRRPIIQPSSMLMERLLAHDWPGNIRELENIMKRFVVLRGEKLVFAELGRLASSRGAITSDTPATHDKKP